MSVTPNRVLVVILYALAVYGLVFDGGEGADGLVDEVIGIVLLPNV